MRNFVHDRGQQIALRGSLGRLILAHDSLCHWQNNVVHARVHEIFEENLLRALLFMDTRIIGQVVGDRLVTVEQISCPEGCVHHFHRGYLALF